MVREGAVEGEEDDGQPDEAKSFGERAAKQDVERQVRGGEIDGARDQASAVAPPFPSKPICAAAGPPGAQDEERVERGRVNQPQRMQPDQDIRFARGVYV